MLLIILIFYVDLVLTHSFQSFQNWLMLMVLVIAVVFFFLKIFFFINFVSIIFFSRSHFIKSWFDIKTVFLSEKLFVLLWSKHQKLLWHFFILKNNERTIKFAFKCALIKKVNIKKHNGTKTQFTSSNRIQRRVNHHWKNNARSHVHYTVAFCSSISIPFILFLIEKMLIEHGMHPIRIHLQQHI